MAKSKAKKQPAKRKAKTEESEPEHDLDPDDDGGEELDLNQFDIADGMPLDEIMTSVNKQAKKNVLKRASEASNPFRLRRPFGIASLDCATGGGMPAGGITQVDAPDGVGKNALCNMAIAQVQRLYEDDAKVAWIWLEVPYDKEHARINGVMVPSSDLDIEMENLERHKRGLPPLTDDNIERRRASIGEFLIGDEGNTEARLQATIDLIAGNSCQIIVLDSIASVVSKYRVETDMEDEPKQSASAFLLSEFQRLCWHHFANPARGGMNMTSLVVINQVRANRNRRSAFDREWTVGGPYAIKHGKLLDVMLMRGKRIPLDTKKSAEGKWVRWEVTKGKAGCHEGGRGEVGYYFKHGFDVYQDVVSTADSMGLLVRSGLRRDLVKPDGEVVLQDLPWGERGASLIKEVYKEPDLYETMYYTCLESAGVSCLHKL